MNHVVIVGAGFAGLLSARQLAKRKGVRVTLVSEEVDFLFTPRLIDALEHTPANTLFWRTSIAEIAKRDGFAFVQVHVDAIMPQQKHISYSIDGQSKTLAFDALILSPGVQPCYYGIPGAQEHTVPLKRAQDVETILHKLEAILNERYAHPDNTENINIVFVGGGPSGVEGIASLRRYAHAWCKKHHAPFLLKHLQWHIIQATDNVLPGFPEKMRANTHKDLVKQHIHLHLNTRVTKVTDKGVYMNDGDARLDSHLVVWTAGVEARTDTMCHDVALERGFPVAKPTLEIAPSVFVAGDAVYFAEKSAQLPKSAQSAMQVVPTLVHNVMQSLRNKPLKKFVFKNKGSIMSVGTTGSLQVGASLVLHGGFVPKLRALFYRYRFWQMTGK